MDKIKEISSNNYALLCNDKSLSGFYKIEKLAEGSYYYCLWPTPEYFYLYHIEKEKYALNCNNISSANKFFKTEDFSEKTGSFVAYRLNENYAHIIFEDGFVETKTFSFVGKEIKGVRPVKTCSDRWFFYDSTRRKYLHYTGTKGYKLDGNLETILTSNIFITYKNNRGKQLVLYNQGKAPVYSRDYFDVIELVNQSTFIGKLYQRNLYCIIKDNNIAYPFGYYTGLPKYVKEHNLFIALKGESYCIIKGEKEIQNDQWKSNTFIFHGNYVLNKPENSSFWKIYNINDGHEIPTNLKNIQIIDEQELTLSVISDDKEELNLSLEDINKISRAFIQKILANGKQPSLVQKTEEKAIKQNETIFNNTNSTIKELINRQDKEKDKPTHNINHKNIDYTKSKLNFSIKYYVFLPWVTIKDNHLTTVNVNCKKIRETTFIAWFVLENDTLIITESKNSDLHNIIFEKKNCSLVKETFKNKKAWTYRQIYHLDSAINYINEEILEKELSQFIAEEHHFNTKIDNDFHIQDKEKINLIQSIRNTSIDWNKSIASISINYYVFVPSISIIDNRIINNNINCDILRGSTFIVWFVHENHTLIITESRRTKVHNIRYIKIEHPLVKKLFVSKLFEAYRQLYPINCANLDTLEKELSSYIIKPQYLETETNKKSLQSLKELETFQTLKAENIMSIEQEGNTSELKFAEFSYNNTHYKLKLDEEWNINDIFYRRRVQYKQIDNIIVILYDFTTDKTIKAQNGCVHYHIYGEGKDKRFDQHIGQNTNGLLHNSINDASKRILLFKRNKKNKLLFQDEVKCISDYTIIEEDSNRNVIFFKLMSVLRYPVIEETIHKKQEKKQTIKKEIKKPSNQTNMSKLQELYDTREKLLSLGITPNADLEKQLTVLEEEIIQNEILPNIAKAVEPILNSVKRKVILRVEYEPKNGLHVQLSQRESANDVTP